MHFYTLIALVALLTRPLCAMYAGNAVAPDMPETGIFSKDTQNTGYRLAYTYDHTLERELKFLPPGKKDPLQGSQMAIRKNGGDACISLGNQLELFGSLGTQNFTSASVFDYFDLYKQTEESLYFGGGASAILVFFRQCTMGISAKYHGSSQMLFRKTDGAEFKGMLQNWQLSFALGREFAFINPYVGLAFDSLKATFNELGASNSQNISFEENNPWVCLIGVGLTKNNIGYINVEGRLIGEMAFSLRASLSF